MVEMISRVNVTKSTFHNTSDPFRNVGKMDPKSKRVGTGLVGAPACGDVMKLQIEVRNSNLLLLSAYTCYLKRLTTTERLLMPSSKPLAAALPSPLPGWMISKYKMTMVHHRTWTRKRFK